MQPSRTVLSWALLDRVTPSEAVLWTSLGRLGALWGRLEGFLGRLGALSEVSRAVLERSSGLFSRLGRS